MPPQIESARTANAFRAIAPRLSTALVVGCAVVVMLIALLLGEVHTAKAVKRNEQLIGDDLVASIERILNSVVSRRRTALSALADQPCEKVERPLAELGTYLRYVRAVALVSNGRLYCSSAFGPIDRSLSAYLTSCDHDDSIGLLAQTPFQSGVPVLTMYSPTGSDAGEQLPAGISLVLELTERFLLSESARTLAVFQALKAKGIKFAIDDFGTQHSNLDVLSRFPFDYVKIDRQFVNQIDTGGAELINGIVSVARHFGLQVIAEGVETEAQHQSLLAAHVHFAQGYLYQRPVRAAELL